EFAIRFEINHINGLPTRRFFAPVSSPCGAYLITLAIGFNPITRGALAGEEREVDITLVQIYRFNLQKNQVAQAIRMTPGLANQALTNLVKDVLIVI
ncbi:hypothetical protein ACEN9I_22365, partial [Kosakonia cowanii]|uniref:hypothetical protein n=1 Tax=Kosakonia cowanii TaxID=208223 RepID=UPI0039A690DF